MAAFTVPVASCLPVLGFDQTLVSARTYYAANQAYPTGDLPDAFPNGTFAITAPPLLGVTLS
jgi:hypothetical protein